MPWLHHRRVRDCIPPRAGEGAEGMAVCDAGGIMAPQESNPWALAQERLKKILDEHSYKNWFSQTQFESCEAGRLVVGVPSQFFADWLKGHYMDAISDTLRTLMPD